MPHARRFEKLQSSLGISASYLNLIGDLAVFFPNATWFSVTTANTCLIGSPRASDFRTGLISDVKDLVSGNVIATIGVLTTPLVLAWQEPCGTKSAREGTRAWI